MWDVKDERELFKGMLAHPDESVCFQVFEIIESFGEEDDVTSLLESTVLVWKKVKKYEREVNRTYQFTDFFDAEETFRFDSETRKEHYLLEP